jgi:hypothetical protein
MRCLESLGALAIVAGVIYAEASPICTKVERTLVASVIKNRIKHPAFAQGKLKTMSDVVIQPGAFTSLRDASNRNWQTFLDTAISNPAKEEALRLASGKFEAVPEIVYYHDRSIQKPKNWDNKWWRAIPVVETAHFIFYKIAEKKIR